MAEDRQEPSLKTHDKRNFGAGGEEWALQMVTFLKGHCKSLHSSRVLQILASHIIPPFSPHNLAGNGQSAWFAEFWQSSSTGLTCGENVSCYVCCHTRVDVRELKALPHNSILFWLCDWIMTIYAINMDWQGILGPAWIPMHRIAWNWLVVSLLSA